MARRLQVNKVSKRRAKSKVRVKKKDPIFVNGQRPRPMYVDYKDVELLGSSPTGRARSSTAARAVARPSASTPSPAPSNGPLHGPAAVYGRIVCRRIMHSSLGFVPPVSGISHLAVARVRRGVHVPCHGLWLAGNRRSNALSIVASRTPVPQATCGTGYTAFGLPLS